MPERLRFVLEKRKGAFTGSIFLNHSQTLPGHKSFKQGNRNEFLRLLFLQAHRETTALHRHRHASATTLRLVSLPPRGILQWPEEQSRSGCGQDGGNAINLNIDGCGVVAPPVHSSLRAPHLLANLLAHNLPLPRAPPVESTPPLQNLGNMSQQEVYEWVSKKKGLFGPLKAKRYATDMRS